jgi:Kef-type K+ transport system membrane component KefB
MDHLTPHDVMVVFLALAALLASAKFAGELVKKFNQPSVLGEIIAGILLGPTVLGHYKPTVYALLFPHTGPVALVLEGITAVSVVFFLLTAGIEIDLASIFRQGKSALLVSSFGMVTRTHQGRKLSAGILSVIGIHYNSNRLRYGNCTAFIDLQKLPP